MKSLQRAIASIALLVSCLAWSANSSPSETNFIRGSKEDLEIRLEWAKKDPCYKHEFSADSLEAQQLKKYWAIKNGPYAATPNCSSKTK